MDALNYGNHYKIFTSIRMNPWQDDHALFIRKELAMMKAGDESDKAQGETFRKAYDEKMKEHLRGQIAEVKASIPEEKPKRRTSSPTHHAV